MKQKLIRIGMALAFSISRLWRRANRFRNW